MEIIRSELLAQGIDPRQAEDPILRRVIHATADFDYARSLCDTPNAVAELLHLLHTGTIIVTDTNMAKAGISRPALDRLGLQVHCLMAEPETAALARSRQSTRAAAAMQIAAQRYPKALYVIGNAPTALMALAELAEQGTLPAGVIGVPVGFVNVVESKERMLELCQRLHIPGIFAMGRKGGSTVAAAVCNALLYAATDTTDPVRRGW